MKKLQLLLILLIIGVSVSAKEYHVAKTGNDKNNGTSMEPFLSIQHAAELAQPGDIITVRAGVYRERINPPRGGESGAKRIVYQAAPGEKVTITGSEVIKNWVKVQDNVWKVTLPNSFFGNFNPYDDLIHGDWFDPKGRQHHTGGLYLNGHWYYEAALIDEILKPMGANLLWFGKVENENTTIWAQFKEINPNSQNVEINVRQTVFYPEKPFVNYITVRGFILENGAPNWAPPTAEQKAIIGTHWSKGWLIENNIIRHSPCSGLSLGKYGDEWDNNGATGSAYDNTIARALKNGWNRDTIGHHIVRNNEIYNCEQTGIVGSLGAAFSLIERNHIHDIHVRRVFGGAEQAGLKFHGAIDAVIRDNHFHHCYRGMHLDWMSQGVQILGNLCHSNGEPTSSSDQDGKFYESRTTQDIFLEVNNGPMVVANNLLLSNLSVFNASHGTLFGHNLLREIQPTLDRWIPRMTPYHKAHSTEIAGSYDNRCGDDRFINNLLVSKASLAYFDTKATLPITMEGNVFTNGTTPAQAEKTSFITSDFDPEILLESKADGYYLTFQADPAWSTLPRRLIEGKDLGLSVATGLPFENSDGSPVQIATDYFGKPRNPENPFPGSFENVKSGKQTFKVWPK